MEKNLIKEDDFEKQAIEKILNIIKEYGLTGASVDRVLRAVKYQFSAKAQLRD